MLSNPPKQVSEKDKPFVLALVASGITVLTVLMAFVETIRGQTPDYHPLEVTLPLTATAWAYYFAKN